MEKFNLAVLFSKGVAISQWLEQGLYDREVFYYRTMLKSERVKSLTLFTYDVNPNKYQDKVTRSCGSHKVKLVGIPAILNSKIGHWLYSFLFPLLNLKKLSEIHVIRSNQALGGWAGALCNVFLGKPFLFRTGYTLSLFKDKTVSSGFKKSIYLMLEKFCLIRSFATIVASRQDEDYLISQYGEKYRRKIVVNKNYIDSSLFRCSTDICEREDAIIFVGRLNNQKNLKSFLEAHKNMDNVLPLHVVGEGEAADELKATAGSNVVFHGAVANDELPIMFNRFKYYVLPSLFEGMPKALLEAMACGCFCIATNVAGNNEVVVDKVNGCLVVGTSSEDLKVSLNALASCGAEELKAISNNAQRYIEQEHNVSRFCNLELKLINDELSDN